MPRRRRKWKVGSPLLEEGVLAILIGVGFLAAPLVFGTSPMLRPVVQGLKAPGWLAVCVGLLLLAVHRVSRRGSARVLLPGEGDEPAHHPGSPDIFPLEIPPAPGEPRLDQSESSSLKATASPSTASGPRQAAWSERVFSDIEWRRFEAVCERLFAQGGFETKSQSHGADGGVDIWLYSKNSEGPAAVVQCKHWVGKPVGVKELREFFGVMASKSLKRGTFATSSTFTPAAIEFQ